MNRPVIFLFSVYAAGLFAAYMLFHSFGACFVFCLLFAGLISGLSMYTKKNKIFLYAFAAGFVMHAVFYHMHSPYIENLVSEPGKIKKAVIKVSTIPKTADNKIKFRGTVRAVKYDGKEYEKAAGRVMATLGRKTFKDISYGDILEISGRFSRPFEAKNPGGFSYREYLEHKRTYVTLYAQDYNARTAGQGFVNPFFSLSQYLRKKFEKIIDSYIPEEEAKIAQGIMLGNQAVLNDDIHNAFIRTGTVHILAVSGMNVGLVALFVFLIFKLIGMRRRYTAALTLVCVWVFALVTGGDPSITRAAVMASFILAGIMLERDTDILNSLAAAGLVILLISPGQLFDVGFQLSFLATAGIVYFSDYIKRFSFGHAGIFEIIAVTVMSQIFLFPVMADTFNHFSIIAVIANLVAVPLASAITILGFVMWGAGMILPYAAELLGASLWVLIKILMFFVNVLGSVPYAAISIKSLPVLFIIIYYVFFLMLPYDDVDVKIKKVSLKVCLGIILAIWGIVHIFMPVSGYSAHYISSGGINAVLHITKDNKKVLVIGCDSGKAAPGIKYEIVPYMKQHGINNVDLLAVYNTRNEENVNELKRNFRVKNIFRDTENVRYTVLEGRHTVVRADSMKISVDPGEQEHIFVKVLSAAEKGSGGKIIYPCFYSLDDAADYARENYIIINGLNRSRGGMPAVSGNVYNLSEGMRLIQGE
ncbi:MAG: ComEC/Rec2 family competence protein [Candidatus Goldiibacteriota bacterium]